MEKKIYVVFHKPMNGEWYVLDCWLDKRGAVKRAVDYLLNHDGYVRVECDGRTIYSPDTGRVMS